MADHEFTLFGMPYYGEPKTDNGNLYWHEQDGVRYPLLPTTPRTSQGERDE